MARLARRGLPIDDTGAARVRALVPSLQPRARTLEEMADGGAFVLERPEPDAKAAGQLTGEARERLATLAGALETVAWDGPALETLLCEQAEAQGVKLGALAQPLRAALTGRTQSPPIDAVLLALGREESLRRIRSA